MNSRPAALAFALMGVVAACGCGAKTPTEPTLDGTQWGITAHIRNAEGRPTILRCQGFLDGSPLSQAQSFSSPVAQVTLTGAEPSFPRGLHTFSVQVLDQTDSPSPYVFFDLDIDLVVIDSRGVSTPETNHYGFQVPGTLATGDSITVTFGY